MNCPGDPPSVRWDDRSTSSPRTAIAVLGTVLKACHAACSCHPRLDADDTSSGLRSCCYCVILGLSPPEQWPVGMVWSNRRPRFSRVDIAGFP